MIASRKFLWWFAVLYGLSACAPNVTATPAPAPVVAPQPSPTSTSAPPPAPTSDPLAAFVGNLQTALQNNDDATLKNLIGVPWFSGRYKGDLTQYADAANALAAFRALRQGALITLDPSRVTSAQISTQKLGERALMARWVSRSGGESLAYLYLSSNNQQWRWTALVMDVPPNQAASQPTVAPTPNADVSFGSGQLVFTSDNKLMMHDLSTSADSIVTDITNGQRTQWDWTRDGARVMFVENKHVWTMNRDGSGLRQLTSGRAVDSAPHWSSDGAQILFGRNVQRDRSQQYQLRGEVWLMNADGTSQRKLADGFDAAWSPNVQRVAFASNAIYVKGDVSEWTSYAHNSIRLINTQGRNEWSPLTTELYSPKFTEMEWQLNTTRLLDQPQWSPDGRELAVRAHGNHGAYITTDTNSGGLTKFLALYFDGVAHGLSYSPDGASLALGTAGLSGWATVSLYQRSAIARDGVSGAAWRTLGRVPKQTGDVGQKVTTYEWSPDSTRIAYVVVTYPNNDLSQPPASTTIWIMDVTTGAARQLANGDGPLFWIP